MEALVGRIALGDVIVALDGEPVLDACDFCSALAGRSAGALRSRPRRRARAGG